MRRIPRAGPPTCASWSPTTWIRSRSRFRALGSMSSLVRSLAQVRRQLSSRSMSAIPTGILSSCRSQPIRKRAGLTSLSAVQKAQRVLGKRSQMTADPRCRKASCGSAFSSAGVGGEEAQPREGALDHASSRPEPRAGLGLTPRDRELDATSAARGGSCRGHSAVGDQLVRDRRPRLNSTAPGPRRGR